MKRLIATTALAAAVWAAASAPIEPAGACSILCPAETLRLELVEVRLVDGPATSDSDVVVPTWPESGTYDAYGAVWFDDEDQTYLYVSELEGGE